MFVRDCHSSAQASLWPSISESELTKPSLWPSVFSLTAPLTCLPCSLHSGHTDLLCIFLTSTFQPEGSCTYHPWLGPLETWSLVSVRSLLQQHLIREAFCDCPILSTAILSLFILSTLLHCFIEPIMTWHILSGYVAFPLVRMQLHGEGTMLRSLLHF